MNKDSAENRAIGHRVASLRSRAGLTQAETARRMNRLGAGWDGSTCTRTERSTRQLPLCEAEKLAYVFGCSVMDFLYDPEVSVPAPEKLVPPLPFERPSAGLHPGQPVCCAGECCGPGSYCCVNAGPHEH